MAISHEKERTTPKKPFSLEGGVRSCRELFPRSRIGPLSENWQHVPNWISKLLWPSRSYVTPVFPLLKRRVCSGCHMLVNSVCWLCAVESRKHFRSSQVFRSRETYSRNCSWGITGTSSPEGPHLHQDLIYTRSTVSQWCTGMRFLGPLGGGEHIWHTRELDKICVLKVDHGRLKKW